MFDCSLFVAGLEEELCTVGGAQAEHVPLLGVVRGAARNRVVNPVPRFVNKRNEQKGKVRYSRLV